MNKPKAKSKKTIWIVVIVIIAIAGGVATWLLLGNKNDNTPVVPSIPTYSWDADNLPNLTLTSTFGILTAAENGDVHPDLKVEMALLESGLVKITWNYADKDPSWKEPWAVPSEVLDID